MPSPAPLKSWHEKIQGMIANASGLELELIWIPKIMAKQTHDEKVRESTIEYNEVGLNAYDAKFVTSLYNHVTAGAHLTIKQAEAARKVLSKYWKQYAGMMSNIQTRASVS